MSQPAFAALEPLPFELVFEDGEPLDDIFHGLQIHLARDVIRQAMAEQGRDDFFVGGNNFVYYSREQARDVAQGKPYYRGPDVYFVQGVDPSKPRRGWVAWEEGGRLPDFILEILSPSTAHIDRTVKKDLYAKAFRTAEYFLYDPARSRLEGFRLGPRGTYQALTPQEGRFWSEQLGAFVGLWEGVRDQHRGTWVRLYHQDGSLVPAAAEAEAQRADMERQRADEERQRAEAESQRAEAERQRAEAAENRADAAEAELARLRALLAEHGPG